MENIFKFHNDLPTRPRKSNVEVVLIMISSLWFVLLSSVASDSTHKLRGWDWDAPLIYSQSRTSAASLSYNHTMGWKKFWGNILLLSLWVTRLELWRLMYHSWHKLQSKVAKCFFDICNAEMAQWRQKSGNLDIQSQFSICQKRSESF